MAPASFRPDHAIETPPGTPADGLDRVFAPQSIAIIGATDNPGLPRDLLLTLRSRRYEGDVYAVNPHRREVLGAPCYPDIASVPADIDLAMVFVPPEATPAVVAECAQAKVRGVVVVSAGFAELGAQGRGLQARLGRRALEGGLWLLGPNCIGFMNVPRNITAMAIPPASVPEELRPGPVGVVSQSAGLLISAMEYGSQIGVGFSLLVSTGNEEQVDATRCLEYLIEDPGTKVIGLVLEAVRDGRRLLESAARARDVGKVIVALKLGRSTLGAQAALTHTAALAGAGEIFDAACRDAGVETVSTIAEFVDHLAFYSKRRVGVRGGLAAITISGGTKVLVADLADRYGVRLADLSPPTRERLARAIPNIAVADNPLDVTAAAIEDAGVIAQVVDVLNGDPDVGVIALVLHLKKRGGSPAHQRLVRRFTAHADRTAKQLVVISSIPEGISGFWREEAAGSPVPFLNDLAALKVLRSVTAPEAALLDGAPFLDADAALPSDVQALLNSSRPIIAEADAYRLLEAAGIAVAPYEHVQSRDEAIAAAGRLGYPVALKVTAMVAHKAAMGLVRLGLRAPAEVARAYEELAAIPLPPGLRQDGMLVQAMITDGTELLLGARIDPQFGPVVAVGLGGIGAEAWRDLQFGLAPITPGRARALLDGTRAGVVVRDLVARSGLDLDALTQTISRFSLLAARLAPWVASLEINPLIVTARGCVAVDALAQLKAGDRDAGRSLV